MLNKQEADLIQQHYNIDINADPEGIDKLIGAIINEQQVDGLDNDSEELTDWS